MKNEFALAFNEVLEEKQLPKEIILAAIESAMVSAYRRAVNASNAQLIEAKIDPESGKVTIYAEKEVVEDVQDQRTEVSLTEANEVNPEAQLGDMVVVDTTPMDFGRVAAQTARQVIQQRIREAERQVQTEYFQKQVGEIISGIIQSTNSPQGVTVGLDMKAEGIMPANQKIPGERFKVHDRIRALVLEVKDSPRGPQIILSRSHRDFLRRLLENEVPEIYHGIVEIRAIAREPGQRAKVAVFATQAGVDPVGACVGIRGVRVQAIVKELHDEKIDIIEWNPDTIIYISKAISPARVTGVYLSPIEKTATVVVQEDQLSLAIGRDGQNARLAAKLTGWRIDIKSLSEAAGDAIIKIQGDPALAELTGIEEKSITHTENILTKKSEGRPITPEEYFSLMQFVDRIERRTMEEKEAEAAAEEERIATARAEIPEVAFETSLDYLGLSEHIFNILTEAEFHNIGELQLALKLNSDSVLGLAGIGPKSMTTIENALASVSYPEPEVPIEPVAELPTEVLAVEPEPVASEQVEPQPEAIAEMQVEPTETPPAEQERIPELEEAPAEKETEEKDLEKLFTLQPDMLQPSHSTEEEEPEKTIAKKKKKRKQDRKLEYDPEKDQVVAYKQHKRDEGEWSEWE